MLEGRRVDVVWRGGLIAVLSRRHARRHLVVVSLTMALVAAACGDGTSTGGNTAELEQLRNEVSRLEAELFLATSTTSPNGGGPTASTPPPIVTGDGADLAALLDTVFDGYADQAAAFGAKAAAANAAWEDRSVTFESAERSLVEVAIEAELFAAQVKRTPIPEEMRQRYSAPVEAVNRIPLAAQALLQGLKAPDDGTLRRNAAALLDASVNDFVAAADFI